MKAWERFNEASRPERKALTPARPGLKKRIPRPAPSFALTSPVPAQESRAPLAKKKPNWFWTWFHAWRRRRGSKLMRSGL
jgi:hypothetical protein